MRGVDRDRLPASRRSRHADRLPDRRWQPAPGEGAYALSLGLLVGFFDLIPLVGATLGAIFVAIAMVDFPTATIMRVAFIIVYQRVENSLVQPAR